MNIIIFGAGSIGCYVGGKLAAKFENVILFGRERIQKVINEHGLTLTHYELDVVKLNPANINYSSDFSCLREADLIIICVKSQDTISALQQIKEHANPNAVIVSLQNGVKNPALLKEYLPDWKTAAGMVPYNVTNKGDGHFHCGTEGELVFERTYETGLLVEKCNASGLSASLTDDIMAVLWGKLLLNLNNALNVLSDKPLKQQLADKNYRKVLSDCIEEALDVLKLAGIKPQQVGKANPKQMMTILRLPNFLFTPISNTRIKIDPLARSSMWEDLQAGRTTEIDYINGAIIELAEQHATEAPLSRKIIELVKEAFVQGASPAFSGEELLQRMLEN